MLFTKEIFILRGMVYICNLVFYFYKKVCSSVASMKLDLVAPNK